MSGNVADQDNSIEEILASIRQIISEDEAKPEQPAPEAAPALAPEPPATAEDVFELVDRVVAEEEELAPLPVPSPPPEPQPDALFDPSEAAPEPVPVPSAAPEPAAPPLEESVFSDTVATATLGAFSKLSDTIALERQKSAAAGVTLEEIVKDLLSPLLRQWIDQHVPAIVERLVQEELEKLARQAREG